MRIYPIPTINKWFSIHTREWYHRGHLGLDTVIIWLTVSKRLSKVKSSGDQIKSVCPRGSHGLKKGDPSSNPFQNTDQIVFVLFISLFFDLLYQIGYQKWVLFDIKRKKCLPTRQLRPEEGNPLQFFKTLIYCICYVYLSII